MYYIMVLHNEPGSSSIICQITRTLKTFLFLGRLKAWQKFQIYINVGIIVVLKKILWMMEGRNHMWQIKGRTFIGFWKEIFTTKGERQL